jgi:hypothetical protein
METVKLYDLSNEATRSLRFIDEVLHVKSFSERIWLHCIIVKVDTTESEHIDDESDIKFKRDVDANKIFDTTGIFRKVVDISGTLLVLSRRNGFLEVDVVGTRCVPTMFKDDINVVFKDPAKRDVAYVSGKYPDAYGLLLGRLKALIQRAIVYDEGKRRNLVRIINYIKKIDADETPAGSTWSYHQANLDSRPARVDSG